MDRFEVSLTDKMICSKICILYQEYIIKERRVSNHIKCVRKVT